MLERRKVLRLKQLRGIQVPHPNPLGLAASHPCTRGWACGDLPSPLHRAARETPLGPEDANATQDGGDGHLRGCRLQSPQDRAKPQVLLSSAFLTNCPSMGHAREQRAGLRILAVCMFFPPNIFY